QADLFSNDLAVLVKRLVRRIGNHHAVETVQQGVLAAFQLIAERFETDHGGNSQGPRHDGSVGGFAAHVGGEAEHVVLVELRRVGGRQVMTDDNARFFEVAQVELGFETEQVIENAGGNIAHIGGPLAQVIVINGGESRCVTLRHGVKGIFGINAAFQNHAH